MAQDNDLNQFRKEWLQEVSKSSSRKSANDIKQDVQKKNASSYSSSSICESHLDNVSYSENLQQKKEDFQKPTSSYIAKSEHDTDEYYPFKIVTQFLNEAPRKVKFSRKRTKMEKIPEMTFSKKKYFYNAFKDEQKTSTHTETEQEAKVVMKDARILDLFIADLDEINEIPFFDSSLPRELALKIFQHLDMTALCNCAQVSHSWRSLADDELLWCQICHKLGFDTSSKVFEGRGWKERVKHHMHQKKALEANWKARTGKPYKLNFAKGGILCSVASHDSTVVAGYTSCQVRSWNTISGDMFTLNASNTALVIDESSEDLGCIQNEIKHLSTTAYITAASFVHGFVDVWRNDQGIDPIHTIVFNNPDVNSLCTQDVNKYCSLVAASQQTRIQVMRIDEVTGTKLADIDMKSPVYKIIWMDGCQEKARLIISCSSSVWMKDFDLYTLAFEGVISQDNMSMVEVHSMIYAPVTCLGARQNQQEVGIGFNMITGSSSQVKLNVYDLNVREPKASLSGHTWLISCMDLPQGLPDQLVTGSGDRKVRHFDLRAGTSPILTMIGHSAKVTCVQMDKFKVVSGDEAGFVCVWDVRNGRKLWDIHNRHPVQYCHFEGRLLIIGNIPYDKFPETEGDEFESVSSLRYRGTVQFYDFLADQQTHGVPEICLSSYNEPDASDYNLGLAVPYDHF